MCKEDRDEVSFSKHMLNGATKSWEGHKVKCEKCNSSLPSPTTCGVGFLIHDTFQMWQNLLNCAQELKRQENRKCFG